MMLQFLQDPTYTRYGGVFLAILTPVVGLLTLSYRRQDRGRWMALPLFWLLAFSGPLLVGLWWIFNAIEETLGLDSILAMLLNLAFFALIGIGIGALLRMSSGTLHDPETRQSQSGETSETR
ncbi:MAG TPA: hypothetical protein PLA90_00590 [Candidatus Sumerlaeota bacterium]|nr:hypothetical protein [Candidatus Sumerlaeota bacterium]HPS00018.1 hypothetical protein [Candidatus Sumerlaeota bacterium]